MKTLVKFKFGPRADIDFIFEVFTYFRGYLDFEHNGDLTEYIFEEEHSHKIDRTLESISNIASKYGSDYIESYRYVICESKRPPGQMPIIIRKEEFFPKKTNETFSCNNEMFDDIMKGFKK